MEEDQHGSSFIDVTRGKAMKHGGAFYLERPPTTTTRSGVRVARYLVRQEPGYVFGIIEFVEQPGVDVLTNRLVELTKFEPDPHASAFTAPELEAIVTLMKATDGVFD